MWGRRRETCKNKVRRPISFRLKTRLEGKAQAHLVNSCSCNASIQQSFVKSVHGDVETNGDGDSVDGNRESEWKQERKDELSSSAGREEGTVEAHLLQCSGTPSHQSSLSSILLPSTLELSSSSELGTYPNSS